MAIHNTLTLLLFISYVSISTSHISPSPGPASTTFLGFGSSPSPGHASAPSMRPTSNAPGNHISQPPSESISPNAGGPSAGGPSASMGGISSTPSGEVNPGVKTICKSTDYPDLCESTVTPGLSGDPNIPTVLHVSVDVGVTSAKQAMAVAKELAGKPENANQAESLRDCVDFYSNVLDNYAKALSALPEQDVGTMKIMLSAAITDIGDCEDALKGKPAGVPLKDLSEKLTNMTSNSLAIATLMRA